MAIGTNPIENYIPAIKYNEGLYTALPMYIAGDLTVTGTTTIAGISLTDLTVTGNTTIGNATSDTLAVTGNSTFDGTAAGNVIDITTAGTTTGKGIDISSNTALTTGILAHIASSATAITGAGRLFYSNHTGATSTSGTLNEFVTSANDETILLGLTGNSITTGSLLSLSATGLSTGKAITATVSSSSTGGSNVEPIYLSTTMTGAGGLGGRLRSSMTTNVALGAYSNAIKGDVTYGASGSTTGLGSAILAEMTLSAGTSAGTYAPLEIELNMGAGSSTGTASSLIYASVNQTGTTAFDDNGFILNLAGLTAGSGDAFQTGLTAATVNANTTAALKIKIGSTTYYIPVATATA